jgi:SAM-dependent methyltransferase
VYDRLLEFLCCPTCQAALELDRRVVNDTEFGPETIEGELRCSNGHSFAVRGGIPRMLPNSADADYDRRTSENFSLEWQHHELGDRTWGIELDDRVQTYFLDSIGIPTDELDGKLLLDAGCGNGSQSVAYTRYGLEVVAVDLSSGLEAGYRFRHVLAGARPDRVHFVQGDLQNPPLKPNTFDIVHSAGVLHHTPNTKHTFLQLRPLLKPGGTFYIWLYKYEKWVTPLVNSIRAVTTRIPPAVFAKIAAALAVAFQLFCWFTNATGIRTYPAVSRREAALALMDIFGAPYAHYHSLAEVDRWFRDEGFVDVWGCNESRRGFGACARLGPVAVESDVTPPL